MFKKIRSWLKGEKFYDVLLSYASENGQLVERVAERLKTKVDFFYDKYETGEAWGEKLPEFLEVLYRYRGRLCVVFASEAYKGKQWTTKELRSALAKKKSRYVLLVRLDDATLPGLEKSEDVYVDLRGMDLQDDAVEKVAVGKVVTAIIQKVEGLKRRRRRQIAVAVAAALPLTVPAGYAVREFIEPDPTIKLTEVLQDTLKVSITNRGSRPLDLAGFQILFRNVPIVKTELVRVGETPLHLGADDHIDLILNTKEYRLDTRCNKVESRHFVRNEIQGELAGGHAILKIRTRDPGNPFWTPTAHSDPIPATVLSDFVLPRIPTRAPRTCS